MNRNEEQFMSMKHTSVLAVIVAPLLCSLLPTTVVAVEATAIEPVETRSNIFSGAEVKFHYPICTTQPLDGQLNWSLSVNGRTVEHGQLPPARTKQQGST